MNERIWFVGLACWLFLGITSESLAQQIGKSADWDVEQIRVDGDRFLFESIPKSNFKRRAIEHAVTSKTFPLQLEDLADNEIIGLCDYRASLRQIGEDITECPRRHMVLRNEEEFYFPLADKGQQAQARILKYLVAANGGGASAQGDDKKIRWNVWVDKKKEQTLAFAPVEILEPGHDYLLAIDLSALRYDMEQKAVSTQPASPVIVDLLSDPTKMPDELEILLLHDKAFFDPPKESVQRFKVCKENIKNRANIKPIDKPFTARAQSKKECTPDFLFGHAFLPITTKEDVQGPTSLGLSIWANKRPVDEVSLQICIATEPAACKGRTSPKLSFKGIDSLRVDSEIEFPDAALHFLVKDPKEGVIGVFRRNDKTAEGKFIAWPLNIPADDLLSKFTTKLIPALEDVANQPFSTSEDLAKEAITVYDALFPTTTSESKAARKVFEGFLKDYLQKNPLSADYVPPSLFVRMVQSDSKPPLPIPLGLLSIDNKFLGNYFRIESPLEIQNYEPNDKCIANWIIVAPSLTGPKDGALQNAFAQASDVLITLRNEVEEEQDFDSIGNSKNGFRPWIRAESPKQDRASALMVLSHHDSDALYFDKDKDRSVVSDSINREFGMPSIVILNGCGTGGGGARYLIRRFNEKGFATMIALSTQVGATLAGDYVGCLAAELQNNIDSAGIPKSKPVPISLAHYYAINRCLSKKKPDDKPDTQEYGPRVLAYTILGNGNLRVCPPKKGVTQ